MSEYTEPKTTTIERRPIDGRISVNVVGDSIIIECEQVGMLRSIECTEYDARRILGALSVILGLPLKPDAAKAIQMGGTVKP